MRKMKIALAILLIATWYGALAVMVHANGWLMGVAIWAVSCIPVLAVKLIEQDEEQHDDVAPEGSCVGCKNDLGGGHCRINMERECREGGGFELWEGVEDEAANE